MAHIYPKVKISNGMFGPTNEGHYYKPAPYHNKTASRKDEKTTWLLKQGEQFEVFRLADEGHWYAKKPSGLFSILENGKEVFGVNGERIAFFPSPRNSNDPWHGYPVGPGYTPDDIADKWFRNNVIDRIQHNRLIGGRL